MNKLDTAKRSQIVRCLVDGVSIRGTVRITGASKNTIAKLLVELGAACGEYLDRTLVNLNSKRIQCDEIWSFVAAKEKNVTPKMVASKFCGDAWTWIAIDADTKLICSWLIGKRDPASATQFIQDLAGRLTNRVQLTTDGLKLYLTAVDDAFRGEIDYAQLIKVYGIDPEGEKRYSPAICTSCESRAVSGNPEQKYVNTSYVERQNLTMRMSMRRFTRLTNAFSKKLENHIATVAIHTMYYNFVRVHQTLRVTPAMAAGLTERLWDVEDLVGLLG
ncbi:MAG: DDE-type integrase/transposase/recombinase [Bryobacteraceae bacterium]|jgi:IS1 family transposase